MVVKEKSPPKRAAVFYASAEDGSDAVIWEKARRLLSPARVGQAKRMAPKQARLSLCAALLLQKALSISGLLGEGEPLPPLAQRAGGKPYLPDLAVEFSLSHAGGRVLCALSDHPVGCDLERFRTPRAALAGRWFAPEEQDWLARARTAQEACERFFLLWTWKESYGKMTSEGIFSTARHISVKFPPAFAPLPLPIAPFGQELLPGPFMPGHEWPIALCRDGRIIPNIRLSSFSPEENYCLSLCFPAPPDTLNFYKIII